MALTQNFKKKPIIIKAIQWNGDNKSEILTFIGGAGCYRSGGVPEGIFIQTLEGEHFANVNDWIIRGVKGEFYPCKPDIFAQTYEPAQLLASDEKLVENLAKELRLFYISETAADDNWKWQYDKESAKRILSQVSVVKEAEKINARHEGFDEGLSKATIACESTFGAQIDHLKKEGKYPLSTSKIASKSC